MLESFLLRVVGSVAPDSFTAYYSSYYYRIVGMTKVTDIRGQWSNSQLHEATALAVAVLS